MTANIRKSFPAWTPPEIIAAYSEKNINYLFEWQSNVLDFAEANEGNIVYSAPTSAGKSIVAELIALRLALTGRKVLFLLPYISVARERMHFLQRAWRRVDVQVAAFVGAQSASSREWMAAVCTTEKANSLINHSILDGHMDEIGLVVVDELHMIYDPSRGGVLEALCAKILLWNCRKPSSAIRIIGMSATLENLEDVGRWLNAKVIATQFRPIELHERICCSGRISDLKSGAFIRDVPKRFCIRDDPECVLGLAAEGIFFRKLVLVFCSSKADVEKVALDLAKVLDDIYRTNQVIAARLDRAALHRVRTNLEQRVGALDAVLAQTLPRGVAFHHAGLTTEESECIENGFRCGAIIVLVATSTLSSGVNLPASRVVIKAQIRGPAAINSTTYKQMSGRSGRLGQVEIVNNKIRLLATGGFLDRQKYVGDRCALVPINFSKDRIDMHQLISESILAIRQNELQEVLRVIRSAPYSTVNLVRDQTKLFLECVCNGLATSAEDLEEVSQLTLFKPLKNVEDALCDLVANRFIVLEETKNGNCNLSPTQLGRAALVSSLPPDAALFVFADLQLATRSIALDTELHMLYLVTPTNCSVWQGCDWNHLHDIFSKLSSEEKRVAKLLHLRFFSALALFDVINEKSISEVARRFRISRGTLQTLQQQSATYAAMVVAFCSRLGWTYLCDLLRGFASRLAFGVRRELTELVSITGIDASRARIFHEHGITSMVELSNSTVRKISDVLSLAVPFNSSNSSNGLNEWLFGEPQIRLNEAAVLLKQRALDSVKEHLRSLGLCVDQIKLPSPTELISESSVCQEDVAHPETNADKDSGYSGMTCSINSSSYAIDADKESGDTDQVSVPSVASSNCDTEQHNASTFDEESIDLFSESMEELTISDHDFVPSTSLDPEQIDDGDVIDDLESSLLKMSLICDNENEEDSFNEAPMPKQLILSKLSSVVKHSNFSSLREKAPISPLVENNFIGTPGQQHPTVKRARQPVSAKSPSTASPLVKTSRLERLPSSVPPQTSLDIEDVCRNESAWNCFIRRSSLWNKVGVALATRRTSPVNFIFDGICLCPIDGSPNFIPLTEEYYPGSEAEEEVCPSSTPSESVTLEKRIASVSSILRCCELFLIDALKDCHLLRKTFNLENPNVRCVSYMAFLGHFRKGDHVSSLREIADKFQWSFDYAPLLQMNPRITSAAQAYLASRLIGLLTPIAVSCSTMESFKLEIRALQGKVKSDSIRDEYRSKPPVELTPSILSTLVKCDCVFEPMGRAAVLYGTGFATGRYKPWLWLIFTYKPPMAKISWAVNNMCMGGFSFNRALCSSLKQRLREVLERLETECFKLVGQYFNLDSSIQVSEVLFSRLKLSYPGGSSTKRHLSTNKAVLEQMKMQHPVVEKILQYRRIKHALSQCLAPMERFVDSDGVLRAHCDMNTATGRIISVEPNVQTVPKEELIDGIGLRHLFKARTGAVLISADYSQLELRVLAHLSEDSALIQVLSSNQDVFTDMSARLGISRDTTKKLCYGIIYGMGVKTLAETVKKSDQEANELIKNFFHSFPRVKTYINNTKERAAKTGFVTTVLETRRIVMVVHDEIIVECPSDEEDDVKQWMRSCMESVSTEFLVALPVKVRSGPNWGSLS